MLVGEQTDRVKIPSPFRVGNVRLDNVGMGYYLPTEVSPPRQESFKKQATNLATEGS